MIVHMFELIIAPDLKMSSADSTFYYIFLNDPLLNDILSVQSSVHTL